MSQLSFLTVEIAGQLVAILVDAVQAVLPMEEIVPVPLAPSRVVGIATKRGHVLTVIDARAAITGDRSSEPMRESVVININGHRYALLVDAIDEVTSVSEDAIGSPPPGMPGIWGDLTQGMIRISETGRALGTRHRYLAALVEG